MKNVKMRELTPFPVKRLIASAVVFLCCFSYGETQTATMFTVLKGKVISENKISCLPSEFRGVSGANADGFYEISVKQLLELDFELKEYITKLWREKELYHADDVLRDYDSYYIQMTPYSFWSERFIFINAYIKKGLYARPVKGFFVVCGGGERFWHAIYSLETKTFKVFEINSDM